MTILGQKGTVVSCLRRGWIFNNDFIVTLLTSLKVNELSKSISIWQSYRLDYSGNMFDTHSRLDFCTIL